MPAGPLLLADVLRQLEPKHARRDIQNGFLGPAVLVGHMPVDTAQAWPSVTPRGLFPDTRALMDAGLSMDMWCWPLRPFRLMGLLQTHLRVGRASNNDVVLTHSSVSRIHAHVMTRQHLVFLMDCGSTQGTWVNDTRLAPEEPVPLSDRDRLAVGEVELRFLRAMTLLDLLTRDRPQWTAR